jgi:hypothetical protein
MVSQNAMLALAMVILAYDLQPVDLESAAKQLAEFDAVNDAHTRRQRMLRVIDTETTSLEEVCWDCQRGYRRRRYLQPDERLC